MKKSKQKPEETEEDRIKARETFNLRDHLATRVDTEEQIEEEVVAEEEAQGSDAN